ncbi:hypothetical protein NQZ79_g6535 [Umbelopsis isabellina]|nr:hypothetical protein NQZ79_g6535 [Umbelopsis isabellina]
MFLMADGAFFVFGDLAVKEEGEFRLLFTLFQVEKTRKTILSDVLTVYAPRHFPGPLASTFLSRSFSDQGVRMRIRKEHRIQVSSPRKRKQVENDKPANRRKFRASPLSDDTTSEASVTTTDEQKPQKIEQITPSKPPSPINKIAPPQPLPQSSMSSQPPYSATTTLPPLTSLPNPSYNSAPLNVSIHREPLTGFPLFQQVMPDIAQYHLSSQKTYSPETTPQLPAPNHHPRDPLGLPRQETCRPGYDYPSDPFESGSMKNSNRPLFP